MGPTVARIFIKLAVHTRRGEMDKDALFTSLYAYRETFRCQLLLSFHLTNRRNRRGNTTDGHGFSSAEISVSYNISVKTVFLTKKTGPKKDKK